MIISWLLRFLKEYQNRGVHIWGLTPENQPLEGLYESGWVAEAMGLTPAVERDFIKMDLGPALVQSGNKNVTLMICDDMRYGLEFFAKAIFDDPEAAKYVSGIAVHWYADNQIPSFIMSDVTRKYPDYFLLGTEACSGGLIATIRGPILGSWSRGEDYADSIINYLLYNAAGWSDWNIALDMTGGPNWAGNNADAPILINATVNEFYKQPMFYAMGHFSKFILEESVRIGLDSSLSNAFAQLKAVAVLRPDNVIVIVILNK